MFCPEFKVVSHRENQFKCNNRTKYLYNYYGQLGDVGTVVHHPTYGRGMVIDDEGTIHFRDYKKVGQRHKMRFAQSYEILFERIITPSFPKDLNHIKKYDYDIRQIMIDNSTAR